MSVRMYTVYRNSCEALLTTSDVDNSGEMAACSSGYGNRGDHQKIEEERSHMMEILDLTLEIIYLLTGEYYVPIRKPNNPPFSSLILERTNDKKILEVIQKIIDLLTGEVPIRCQDVSIKFSVEGKEYVEGHKDLYKDIIMEDQPPLTSPDGSSNGNPPERCPRSLYSRDSTQEDLTIPQHDQNIMAMNEETYVKDDELCKKEEVSPEIGTDGSSNGNPPERCPRPLYSRDSTQEHQEIPQEDQDDNLITIKVEVKEEAEEFYVSDDESCMEIPPEIGTDPGDAQSDIKDDEEEEGHVRIKEEDIVMEISTGTSDKRKPPERCPRPLYSRDSTQEDQEIPQEDQEIPEEDQDEDFIKIEVKDEEDLYVRGGESCKEEEFPPEISTDGRYRRYSVKKYPASSLNGEIEDDDITVESTESNHVVPSSHLVLPEGETFLCSEPGESFGQRVDLHAPQRGQQKEKPFPCSECGKCFSQKQQLVRHQRTHSAEQPFSCLECGKCFTEKWMLVKHQNSHSGEKPFSCTECGRCFSHRRNLASHQMTHTGERPYSCSECGKCFSQKSTLTTHEKIHTGVKPYSCSECGKSFSHKSSLIGHEKVHTGEKPFSCTECGKCFSLKSNLIAHEKVHTGEKPFSCSICGKSFSIKSNLQKHEKVHTGEKPFPCLECGKAFTDRTHLIVHQRTHTGEKPFCCNDCGKLFSRKSNLIEHEKIHRGEKPFSCECGKRFSKKSSFMYHLGSHREELPLLGDGS